MYICGGFLFVTLFCAASGDFIKKRHQQINIADNGSFTILIDDHQWFSSADVFFRVKGKSYSTVDSTLLYVGEDISMGKDTLGLFEKHAMQWRSDCGQFSFFGNIFEYESAIVFEQVFPSSLDGTSSGDADSVISSFPSFDLTNVNNKQDTGFAQWVSWYYTDTDESSASRNDQRRTLVAPGFDSPLLGRWNDISSNFSGGMGGSGVVCVFEAGKAENRAVVISPLNNFMAASHHFNADTGSVSYGIMGNVTQIPTDFSLKTIMFVSTGINGAMREWGELMRHQYGKDDARLAHEKDVTLQYLGYTTDNGAFYYYNTVPGMNYQDTMNAVKSYADTERIPYQYVLLDSWFYYRGSNDGVKEWDAMPEIFPDGVKGVYESTGWLVQAHNRYWAPDAVYATQNNGKYDFIVDEVNNGAAPVDDSFWPDLLETPAATWGLAVYEQDWLFNEVMYVREMLESTSRARTWLLQMGKGATKNNLTIQYCMPYVRHLLQSLEVDSVTQARASDDYKPSEESGQWRIAGQNILINALGLAPSKDGVYSSSIQDGNPYGVSEGVALEPYPQLQSVVAALSAGPIAIADGINSSDRALIMRSCMSDGRLLVPSRPAMTIDKVFHQAALGTSGVQGEVWLAESIIEQRSVYYLFAADVKEAHSIYPSDLSLNASLTFHAFESGDTSNIVEFSTSRPLSLQPSQEGSFVLWIITEVESNGMSLQGELDKWIAVTEARFGSIDVISENEMTVEVIGLANETVTVGFVDSSRKQIVVTCTFDESKMKKSEVSSATLLQRKINSTYLSMRLSSLGTCSA